MSQTEPSSPVTIPRRFPWRRLVQYRLRSLLIVTTVVAVLFAWWSHTARQQREAVAALKEADAFILYDYQVQKLKRPRYWPAWMVTAVGIDYFANVDLVQLDRIQSTSAGLTHLKSLDRLRSLYLPAPDLTDATLEHLQGLTSLKELYLNSMIIIDNEGVEPGNEHFTDAGLQYLHGLTGLEYLSLPPTIVTDAGLARLQRVLPNCKIEFQEVGLYPRYRPGGNGAGVSWFSGNRNFLVRGLAN